LKKQLETLKKDEDFKNVLSRGRRIRDGHLRACAAMNGLNSIRMAITVKKAQGNAVIRNRIRRRIREAIRAIAGEYAGAGADIIIFPDTTTKTAPFSNVKDSIKRIFGVLGLKVKA
jgi:ribonuclease P protein component